MKWIWLLLFTGCNVSLSASVEKEWITDPSLYNSHDMTSKAQITLSKEFGNPKPNK